jgi:aminoglycoside phosphotransferase (APT) family kinase protein
MTFGPEARDWLARAIGTTPRSLRIARMTGATSSSVFLVESARDANPQRFVLRVINNTEWLADEPDLAAHEAAALEEARKASLLAPRLVAYAADGAGFGAPVVLMTFLTGSVVLRPADLPGWLAGLARELAAIHRHTAPALAWHYSSWVDPAALAPPAWTTMPRAWARAIDLVLGAKPGVNCVFLHRDYHPTNVLWHQGVVTGIVDWINACRGPAGVDVAHCRSNLAMMVGPEAADQFLAAYGAVAEGFDYHPYWDLDSVLSFCLPELTYFPPWLDFGLGHLPPEVLYQRADAYLERVLRRT